MRISHCAQQPLQPRYEAPDMVIVFIPKSEPDRCASELARSLETLERKSAMEYVAEAYSEFQECAPLFNEERAKQRIWSLEALAALTPSDPSPLTRRFIAPLDFVTRMQLQTPSHPS